MSYAQTNIQLYGQLQAAGYTEQDLLLVDRAYRLAMQLFAGYYRPNNKPFISHLVGVGSILASIGQDAHVISAGVLHSAYTLGLGCKDRVKPRYRKCLQDALGSDVEELVHTYSSRRWSAEDFPLLATGSKSLDALERRLLVVKLADVHEELLDAGHRYAPRKKLMDDEATRPDWLCSAIDLAAALGSEEWAEVFRQDVDSRPGPILDAICGKKRSSFVLAPGLKSRRWKNGLVRRMRTI